jgi:hypothetical protein
MSKHTNEPRHEKNDDDGLHLRTIPINRIVIGKDHRSHDADAINDMAVSTLLEPKELTLLMAEDFG